jgi:hypothetical protein
MSTGPGKFELTWKEIAVTGAWTISVAGSFLLPLPDWASDEENTSYTQFIYFVATVIAGFLVLYSYKNKDKRFWLVSSSITFLLLIILFFTYSLKRESITKLYEDKHIIIGSVKQPDFNKKLNALEAKLKHKINPNEILNYVGGNAEILWTQKSIDSNRMILILLLLAAFTFTSSFLISFTNLFILYKYEE